MSELVHDYYATRIVQDLEDDLYDSKERIQRLRRWNDQLTAENERLRDGVEQLREMCLLERDAAFQETGTRAGASNACNNCAERLTGLLEGDTE